MTGSIATRISRAERLMEIGGRGLLIVVVTGGLPESEKPTVEIASIIGDDGVTFRRRTNDESSSTFRERMKRDALTEHARLLILGGLPWAMDDRLLDDAEGEA